MGSDNPLEQVGDQVDSTLGSEVQPFIMLPQEQVPTTSLFYQALLKTVVSFVVKTRGDIPVAAEMRSLFHQAAPGFALDTFQTMQEAVEQHTLMTIKVSPSSSWSIWRAS